MTNDEAISSLDLRPSVLSRTAAPAAMRRPQVMGQDAEQAIGGGELDVLLPGLAVGRPPTGPHPPAIGDALRRDARRRPTANACGAPVRAERASAPASPVRPQPRHICPGGAVPGLEGRPAFEQQVVGIGQARQPEGVRAEAGRQPVQGARSGASRFVVSRRRRASVAGRARR